MTAIDLFFLFLSHCWLQKDASNTRSLTLTPYVVKIFHDSFATVAFPKQTVTKDFFTNIDYKTCVCLDAYRERVQSVFISMLYNKQAWQK